MWTGVSSPHQVESGVSVSSASIRTSGRFRRMAAGPYVFAADQRSMASAA